MFKRVPRTDHETLMLRERWPCYKRIKLPANAISGMNLDFSCFHSPIRQTSYLHHQFIQFVERQRLTFFLPSSIVSKLESLNIDYLKKNYYTIFFIESKINFPTWKISKRNITCSSSGKGLNGEEGSKHFVLETIMPRCIYLHHRAINTGRLITVEYIELHFRRKYLSSNIS